MGMVAQIAKGLGAVVGVAAVGLGSFVYVETSRFDASLEAVYDVPLPDVSRSTDPTVVARGRHLVSSVGGCAASLCHGADLGGGKPIEMGPVATLAAPNITPGNLGAAYSDGELARLVRHGVKKDGRSVRFMPVEDFGWLSDPDVTAVVSYLRTIAPVERPNQPLVIKTLGKVLDRQDKLVLDVARHIDHARLDLAPPPSPTAAYGSYVGRLCTGCHGEHLSGGRIPGAPSNGPEGLVLRRLREADAHGRAKERRDARPPHARRGLEEPG
jgi:hypothetical protein